MKNVDWSQVKPDTRVLVNVEIWGGTKDEEKGWEKRYFAKFQDNLIYVYPCGWTSWSNIAKESNLLAFPIDEVRLYEGNEHLKILEHLEVTAADIENIQEVHCCEVSEEDVVEMQRLIEIGKCTELAFSKKSALYINVDWNCGGERTVSDKVVYNVDSLVRWGIAEGEVEE